MRNMAGGLSGLGRFSDAATLSTTPEPKGILTRLFDERSEIRLPKFWRVRESEGNWESLQRSLARQHRRRRDAERLFAGGAGAFLGQQRLHARPQAEEGLDAFRVELRAGVRSEFGEGLIHGEGGAVRLIRGHGVEGVRDGNDAGQPGDLLAGQAVRVAGAVPALVMAADDRDDRSEVGDRFGKGDAVERM